VKNTVLFLFCVSVAALANPALAQSVAQPSTLKGDISAFHGDQNTLVNAIQGIEEASGGQVVDIRFSNPQGMPTYHAVILKAGQVQFFKIEELSKSVVEIDASSRPVWMLNWRDKADIHFAKQAKVSLSSAIRTAEQSKNGAPAVAAGIARSASNPDSDVHAYTVLLDVRGTVLTVAVDIANGALIADPSSLRSY
jgi:uncharacterized membrane protein YkoI